MEQNRAALTPRGFGVDDIKITRKDYRHDLLEHVRFDAVSTS
jgi:hypothetical protein